VLRSQPLSIDAWSETVPNSGLSMVAEFAVFFSRLWTSSTEVRFRRLEMAESFGQ